MTFIDDITKFVFINNEPRKADIIFIPGGSHPEIAETAATLWKEGYAPLIIPSGKYGFKRGYFPGPKSKNELYKKLYNTEYEFLKDVLLVNGVDEKAILKEDEAITTYENAIFSKKITDSLNFNIENAIICCKSFHSRRCLMYYETIYPKTKFIICPSEIDGINKDNWFTTKNGIDKVMGELEKCGSQFGDIIKKLI